MSLPHPSTLTSAEGSGYSAVSRGGMVPLAGVMVTPFPLPGRRLSAALDQLHLATLNPPESEEDLLQIANLPRPWDPGTCTGPVRQELWEWLDEVASWINEEHLWSVHKSGIPECWPDHPHIVHDLALLACNRLDAAYKVTPAALEEWTRYALPSFLDRLRDRAGDGCAPGRHQPAPRAERDRQFSSVRVRDGRLERFKDDVDRTARTATAAHAEPERW